MEPQMKRPLIAILDVLVLRTVGLADSPHFIFANNSISPGGTLTTSFKDAGLGTGTTAIQITVNVSAATAVYQCWNNGGNHPKAGNKETVSTALSKSGSFPVRNGQTTGSLVVGPPSQGNFACPPGQNLFLQSVVYSGTSVADASGNTAEATPDPIETGPIHIFIQ